MVTRVGNKWRRIEMKESPQDHTNLSRMQCWSFHHQQQQLAYQRRTRSLAGSVTNSQTRGLRFRDTPAHTNIFSSYLFQVSRSMRIAVPSMKNAEETPADICLILTSFKLSIILGNGSSVWSLPWPNCPSWHLPISVSWCPKRLFLKQWRQYRDSSGSNEKTEIYPTYKLSHLL